MVLNNDVIDMLSIYFYRCDSCFLFTFYYPFLMSIIVWNIQGAANKKFVCSPRSL